MAKQVVISPENFDKLVHYVTNQPIPNLHNLKQVVEVASILQNAVVMDIQILPKEEK